MALKEPQNSRVFVYLCSSAKGATPCAFKFGVTISRISSGQDRTHRHISDIQDWKPEKVS